MPLQTNRRIAATAPVTAGDSYTTPSMSAGATVAVNAGANTAVTINAQLTGFLIMALILLIVLLSWKWPIGG